MLKYFSDSDELCAVVGVHCGKGEKNDEKKKKMKRNEERNKKKICPGHADKQNSDHIFV